MIESTYTYPDCVYADVRVPKGTIFREKYDQDKRIMEIEFELNKEIVYRTKMSVTRENILYGWNPTRENLRKIIVSGFMDYAKTHAIVTCFS